MSATQGTKTWKRLSGELQAATDRDFERAVLPLARAIWPNLVQPRGMKVFDRAGADLVEFGEDDELVAVVQCKGLFKVEGLADDQFPQFEQSIDSFRKSGLKAGTFAIVHNQDGRNTAITARIENALAPLVTSGQVDKAILWDRKAFLRVVEDRLRDMVHARVYEQTGLMLEQMDQQFGYGRTYVAEVPVARKALSLRRGQPPLIREWGQCESTTNIATALAASDARWTLLTGLFGTGKTSAALHAARLFPNRILYVHAASLEPAYGEGGTNSVMARVLTAMSVFEDFPEDDRGLFHRLAGPMLRQILQANEADSVLIIDALDENRSLSTPGAITRFASALAELRCPIIMTTREEHFRATFGNFDHLFDGLSTKGGNLGEVGLLELEPWSDVQILSLVDAAASEAPDSLGLRALQRALVAGEDADWRDDLLRHPFFLRMIIDLAAEDHAPSRTQVEIIGDWVWSKLARDLRAGRALPVPVKDRNQFIEQMELCMTAVAGEMVEPNGDVCGLTDTIGSDRVIEIYETLLGISGVDLGSAIAVSLIVPVSTRQRGTVQLRFSHRAFQEYFLARHLVNTGSSLEGFPDQIIEFCKHLRLQSRSAA